VLVDAAFNQIRQNAAAVPAVSIRLLEAIDAIAHQVRQDEHRKVLVQHAGMILRSCKENVTGEEDLKDVQMRYKRVMETLSKPKASHGESILGIYSEIQ